MSQKPRPKKKYRPRAVAVPAYLNSLSSDVDRGRDARDEDRVFLLQVANRTVEKVDLALYGRILQIAWVLAAKMERAKELRQCLYGYFPKLVGLFGYERNFSFKETLFFW